MGEMDVESAAAGGSVEKMARSKGRVVLVVIPRKCAERVQEMARWRDGGMVGCEMARWRGGEMARWRVDVRMGKETGKWVLDMQRRRIVILSK